MNKENKCKGGKFVLSNSIKILQLVLILTVVSRKNRKVLGLTFKNKTEILLSFLTISDTKNINRFQKKLFPIVTLFLII